MATVGYTVRGKGFEPQSLASLALSFEYVQNDTWPSLSFGHAMRGKGFEPRSQRSCSLFRTRPERFQPSLSLGHEMRGKGFEPSDPYGSGS